LSGTDILLQKCYLLFKLKYFLSGVRGHIVVRVDDMALKKVKHCMNNN
jgi:hypothetical protein